MAVRQPNDHLVRTGSHDFATVNGGWIPDPTAIWSARVARWRCAGPPVERRDGRDRQTQHLDRRRCRRRAGRRLGAVAAALPADLGRGARRTRVRRVAEDRHRRPCHRRGPAARTWPGRLYRACRRSSPTSSAPTGARSGSSQRRSTRSTPIRWRSTNCSTAPSPAIPAAVRATLAERSALMLTGGSTSVRMFEEACRSAGAAARALLCQAAAARWDVDWTDVRRVDGLRHPCRQAAPLRRPRRWPRRRATIPDPLPIGVQGAGIADRPVAAAARRCRPRSTGRRTSRAISACPTWCMPRSGRRRPARRLVAVDRAAADRVPGVLQVVETARLGRGGGDDLVGGGNARSMRCGRASRIRRHGAPTVPRSIGADAARSRRPGTRIASARRSRTRCSRARSCSPPTIASRPASMPRSRRRPRPRAYRDGRLELWLPTAGARRSRARRRRGRPGCRAGAVTVHPMLVGGSFGAALETDVAAQAAVLAVDAEAAGAAWSGRAARRRCTIRPPAGARADGGAARRDGRDPRLAARRSPRRRPGASSRGGWRRRCDRAARALGAGRPLRGRAARCRRIASRRSRSIIIRPRSACRPGICAAARMATPASSPRCFLDELAQRARDRAGVVPDRHARAAQPRLARCLSTAAALGGWDGGRAGQRAGDRLPCAFAAATSR